MTPLRFHTVYTKAGEIQVIRHRPLVAVAYVVRNSMDRGSVLTR